MDDPLAIYLQDHLAGAVHAIELVERIRDQHSHRPLGKFAADLLVDIKKDRETLLEVARKLGTSSSEMKDMTAWAGEKISRLKLRETCSASLGTYEALELLQLGIHGKW